ncbi:hypothetical protein T492DRAFT_908794 [Pavlovales sp. CCMP2436]|nr:hypothetical protein T492DRAFT_908794 [Pavlovales sp. CCMP2436]
MVCSGGRRAVRGTESSLLLEVRAQLESIAERLGGVEARVERIDESLARIERAAQLPAGDAEPPAAGAGPSAAPVVRLRPRAPRLDELPAELLAIMVIALPPDDELAVSLCCRKLHEAALVLEDSRLFGAVVGAQAQVGVISCNGCARARLPVGLSHVLGMKWARANDYPWGPLNRANAHDLMQDESEDVASTEA